MPCFCAKLPDGGSTLKAMAATVDSAILRHVEGVKPHQFFEPFVIVLSVALKAIVPVNRIHEKTF